MGEYWGKQISVVLALQCCFSMSKTYNPSNEGGSVYELTCPRLTLGALPKLCLYSLFWYAHVQTKILATVHSAWCICKCGVKQFNRVWDQSTSHTSPCHCDTMTYWLICGLVFLSGRCPSWLGDSELYSSIYSTSLYFMIKHLNIHFFT